VSRVSPLSLQYPITITQGPDQCSTSTLHHWTSVSPVSRQYLASISPVPHHPHYFTSVSRASHQYSLTSISSSSRQYLTSTLVSHRDSRSLLITGPAPRQLANHQRVAFLCKHEGDHQSASTVAMWLVMTGLGPPIAAYASAVACERPGATEPQTLARVPQTKRPREPGW
jgi:hypothetical protein